MSKCEHCIVRQFNALKELTTEELERISKCKSTLSIKKGELIFSEGEHLKGIYCIKKGVCKISKMSENGKDQIIHLIQKGGLLGERSIINDEVTNLKATALQDMLVCFIPKEEILKDLHENNEFSLGILKGMANSLKNADNVIVNMAQKTVKQRLAETLLFLDTNFEKTEDNKLGLQLSREDIANMIGTATESAIRLLSNFKKKGVISLKGKEINILNTEKLKKIARGF